MENRKNFKGWTILVSAPLVVASVMLFVVAVIICAIGDFISAVGRDIAHLAEIAVVYGDKIAKAEGDENGEE